MDGVEARGDQEQIGGVGMEGRCSGVDFACFASASMKHLKCFSTHILFLATSSKMSTALASSSSSSFDSP